MHKGFSLLLIGLVFSTICFAVGEETRSTTVHSIKLFRTGNQNSFPVLPLGSVEQLELHFDDFQTSSKSYYYTNKL